MSREMALQAYRHLLRSTRIAFQGDIPMLLSARDQARQKFESNRSLPSGSDELSEQIKLAEEVAKILRENVVQGQATDEGGKYKLRIHEHTERGNNEDIKKGGKGTTLGGKCCSS